MKWRMRSANQVFRGTSGLGSQARGKVKTKIINPTGGGGGGGSPSLDFSQAQNSMYVQLYSVGVNG